MSLQRIKSEVYQEVDALFATAATDELAGDMDGYRKKLDIIAQIAELLGLEAEITTIKLDLKSEDTQMVKSVLSGLTWEAQSLLRTMSDIYINKGLSVFFLNRSERAESLAEHGFCFERFDNYTTYADYHSRDMIIDALRNANIYKVYPSKSTEKRELHTIVENLEKNRLDELRKGVIILDFHKDPEMAKHELFGCRNTQEDKQRRLDFLIEKGINPDELCNTTYKG